jgi:hypothetical protein
MINDKIKTKVVSFVANKEKEHNYIIEASLDFNRKIKSNYFLIYS